MAATAHGRWGVLRRPPFRTFWLAGAVSLLGSEVSALAIPLTAILTLDAGPLGMGLVAASGAAPPLIFGLFAGVWVDRLDRRAVLIGCDLARAAALISVPAAWILGFLSLAYLAAATFVVGIFTVFFDVAHASYLPSLVERDELVDANSKLEVGESLTQFAGPGAGGLLVQVLGAPLAVAFDALSFVGSAGLLARLRARETRAPREHTRRAVLAEVREGLRFVLSHSLLGPMAAYAVTTQFWMSAALAVYLLFAVDELGLSPAVVGVISMAAAPGTIAGALLVSRVTGRFGIGPVASVASFLPAAGVLLMSLARDGSAGAVGLLVLAWFLLALGAMYDISDVSLRQAVTPDALRGRTNATRYFAFFGVMPFGALAGGLLGATLGIRATLLVAGVGLALAGLWIVLSPVRALSRPPTTAG